MCELIRSGIIYKYTNKINGKAYIGLTINPDVRKLEHLKQYKKNTGIDIAIAKYGPANFEYEVLFKTDNLPINEVKEILNKKEIQFIEQYNTYNNGYNQTKGGKGTIGFPCPEKSIEFRKWYNSHKNELLSEETRKKLSENAIKNKDKMHSEDARKKMSVANKYIQKSDASVVKMKNTMKNANKRNGVIINFFDNGIFICTFSSRKECELYFLGKLSLGTIKRLLAGNKSKKYPTYELKYKNGKYIKTKSIKKKIVQLTLNDEYIKTWESAAACEKGGFKRNIVLSCCRHEPHRFSYKGYKWLFEKDICK